MQKDYLRGTNALDERFGVDSVVREQLQCLSSHDINDRIHSSLANEQGSPIPNHRRHVLARYGEFSR